VQPTADINDIAIYQDSGLVFAALETERLGAYFIPALGPAPRWCHFLDSLTEEMEEAPSAGVYDDYKFVTAEELEKLQLGGLVGTSMLRPYMHGFFIDARLHQKATATTPIAYAAVLCYAMRCYAMLCYAMLCYAMLCYAMLCYAMLCYAMLCYAMLC
jgi:ribosome biogenesis protein ENP2